MDYQCKSEIPVIFLTALNGKDGGPVRLHMCAFNVRSLYQNRSCLHDINEDEFDIATSPCLSSIRLLIPESRGATQPADHDHRFWSNDDPPLTPSPKSPSPRA